MAKVAFTDITSPTRGQRELRAAAAPTNAFVMSDHIESFYFNQVSLFVDYTKGNTTALIIRPQYTLAPDAATVVYYTPVSAGTTATTGSVTTITVNRIQHRYVHSGTTTPDIDRFVIELPITTPGFGVTTRVAVGTGSVAFTDDNLSVGGGETAPSVTITGVFMRT